MRFHIQSRSFGLYTAPMGFYGCSKEVKLITTQEYKDPPVIHGYKDPPVPRLLVENQIPTRLSPA